MWLPSGRAAATSSGRWGGAARIAGLDLDDDEVAGLVETQRRAMLGLAHAVRAYLGLGEPDMAWLPARRAHRRTRAACRHRRPAAARRPPRPTAARPHRPGSESRASGTKPTAVPPAANAGAHSAPACPDQLVDDEQLGARPGTRNGTNVERGVASLAPALPGAGAAQRDAAARSSARARASIASRTVSSACQTVHEA
jgi:hypothetical protein